MIHKGRVGILVSVVEFIHLILNLSWSHSSFDRKLLHFFHVQDPSFVILNIFLIRFPIIWVFDMPGLISLFEIIEVCVVVTYNDCLSSHV